MRGTRAERTRQEAEEEPQSGRRTPAEQKQKQSEPAERNPEESGMLPAMQSDLFWSTYGGLLLLVAVAAIICGAMVTLSWVLGPKKLTPYKSSPYECGVAPVGDAKERFPIKFYLVAIVFILFDIEVVFLWPWMTVFKTSDHAFLVTSFTSFCLYMLTFIVGYIYVIRVGAIDWDETTSLEPAKLGLETFEGDNAPEPETVAPIGVTA